MGGIRRLILGVVVVVLVGAIAGPAAAQTTTIVDVPVTFEVTNVNRTNVPCEADGARYPVRGHLVAPASVLASDARTVTLYLHGLEISDAYFRYRGVPGYDFQTEMARLGHASVVVDRLGHGDSGLPNGLESCVGSQADVAHQLVDLLRAGRYRIGSGGGLPFRKIALSGHSFGSFMAEISAMNFENEDALVLLSFAAEGFNLALLADRQARGEVPTCPEGGKPKFPGGPGGYAFQWPDPETWAGDMFYNADPAIVEDAKSLRERSPCGDIDSAVTAALTQPMQYSRVQVPVAMFFGNQDPIFPGTAPENHRALYSGTKDVTLYRIDQAGHTLMLQRSAPDFRAKLSGWLKARGF